MRVTASTVVPLLPGPEETRAITGMELGGVTVFGLPGDLPLWVDGRVMRRERIVLGGGDCAAQQQRPVDGQRFGRVGGNLMVEPGGVGAGGGDGGAEVVPAHQGVCDDPCAGPDRDRIFAGLGGAHAAVGCQVGRRGSGHGATIGHATGTRPETRLLKIA